MLMVLLGVGAAATSTEVTRWGIAVDDAVAGWRNGVSTALSIAATHAASAAVGVAATILAPAALWWRRRGRDAVQTLLVLGGALMIASVIKLGVAEARPPSRLWVIAPDNAQSFPSGHTTLAAAAALAAVLVTQGGWRILAGAVGATATLVVAAARVYLGVHYPIDVLGGVLAAICAALLAAGLVELPPLRRHLRTPAVSRP
ncbi:phosphatase PAP2 family protein [Gordonia amicalis]|nr:phosphatase PAP2 family protein [Gordonia amicalis]NKX79689.1 phosphatase PAP2 family protein [Gordonia amicalis]